MHWFVPQRSLIHQSFSITGCIMYLALTTRCFTNFNSSFVVAFCVLVAVVDEIGGTWIGIRRVDLLAMVVLQWVIAFLGQCLASEMAEDDMTPVARTTPLVLCTQFEVSATCCSYPNHRVGFAMHGHDVLSLLKHRTGSDDRWCNGSVTVGGATAVSLVVSTASAHLVKPPTACCSQPTESHVTFKCTDDFCRLSALRAVAGVQVLAHCDGLIESGVVTGRFRHPKGRGVYFVDVSLTYVACGAYCISSVFTRTCGGRNRGDEQLVAVES
jgi:hypothetical protein